MKQTKEVKYEKVYIEVIVKVNADGSLRPLMIVWDDGQKFKVDRVLHARPRASTKVGGCGMMYTVMIEGKERYLFNEEDGRWFVEQPMQG